MFPYTNRMILVLLSYQGVPGVIHFRERLKKGGVNIIEVK